jgi:hypothetical protein
MSRHLRKGLFAATLLVCAVAHAESRVTGVVQTTQAVSGDAPSSHHALDVITTIPAGSSTTTLQWGLSGFGWFESSDKPCSVLLYRSSLDNAHRDLAGTTWDAPCAGSSPGNFKHVYSDEDDLFVTAAKICTTDKSGTKDNRLKGMELSFSRVTNGVVSAVVKSRREQHTNCSWWRDKVSCPAQQIAIGMDFHYGDKGIQGVKLRCKQVEDY